MNELLEKIKKPENIKKIGIVVGIGVGVVAIALVLKNYEPLAFPVEDLVEEAVVAAS